LQPGVSHHGAVPAAFSHVTLSASDFAASLAFYDAALGALGLTRVGEYVDEEEDDALVEAAAWGSDHPVLWLVPGRSTRDVHVAFAADDRSAVDAFHDAAVAAGGTSHDAPRRWAIYRRGRYGAIVADPDGNLVEVTAPE
jgi:catechol 2,3-dioxygenase-like lactoylglutathione lyase family enzyme